MVNGARSQLESISMQLRTEQDRLTLVESQLEQMRRASASEAHHRVGGRGDADGAEAHRRSRSSSSPRTAALGYTDKHPDIDRAAARDRAARADGARPKVTRRPIAERDAEGRSDLPAEAAGA